MFHSRRVLVWLLLYGGIVSGGGQRPIVAEGSVESGPWSGAVTPTSATVKAKLAREGSSGRLVISKKVDFSEPLFSNIDTAESNRNRTVTFRFSGLEPDTAYYYAPEVDGKIDLARRGRLRTFPEGPASFTFAFASCARTASTNRVFTAILENQPLFYMNTGDFHYLNITNNDLSEFHRAYDRILASPTQAHLYRYVPFIYMWDDHDFGGNASGRLAVSRPAARYAYQQYVPHYPLGAGQGDVPIYQAFTVGRARFILTDLRSERSPSRDEDGPDKSMMGAQQKAWFKRELLACKGKWPLVFWVSTVPWLGVAGADYYPLPRTHTGFVHHERLPKIAPDERAQRRRSEDHWSVYAAERREIADFIKTNQITGVCILHGDAHMLGADDGRHSDFSSAGARPATRQIGNLRYGLIPVMCGGPLDQSPSIKGGPYSQGVYRPARGEGCFGLIRVTDLGNRIVVAFSGRNHVNEEKVSLHFEVRR